MNIPEQIVQFQVMENKEGGGAHVVYVLDHEGKLWLNNPAIANGKDWYRVGQ